MRILHVVHGFPPNVRAGAEYYTYYLSMGQRGNNEVFVFARKCDKTKKEYSIMDEEQNGIKIRRVVNNFTNAAGFLDLYLNDKIEAVFSDYLDKVRPDIVHFQHLLGLSASLPYVARRAGAAVIITLHDYWHICPRVQLIDMREEICEGPQEGHRCARVCGDCFVTPPGVIARNPVWRFLKILAPETVKRFIKYKIIPARKTGQERMFSSRINYSRKVLNAADLVIAPSDFVLKKYIGFGIDASKIKRIYHGMPPGLYSKTKEGPSGKLRIVYLGTLKKHKGVQVLLEAFNLLQPGRTEIKIYGFGDETEKEMLRYYRGITKGGGVLFMGGYDNGRLADILESADVVVVPSVWNETFSIVAREGLLSGTPVIASDAGALPEAVNDGINGLLFKCGDPVDLSKKLERLMDEPGLLESLSRGASETKIKSMAEHASELMDIYSPLMKKRA